MKRTHVPPPGNIDDSPRKRIEQLQQLIGVGAVATWCAGLLTEAVDFDDPDLPPLTWAGGPHAAQLLTSGKLKDSTTHRYWPRVWGARGLMYVWVPGIEPAVVSALDDEAWRVREMAAKVVRRRDLGEAAPALARLTTDDVARVRVAVVEALGDVGEFEDGDWIAPLITDDEPNVRRSADAAMVTLLSRLDRTR